MIKSLTRTKVINYCCRVSGGRASVPSHESSYAIYRRHALAAEPESPRPDGMVAKEHLELAALVTCLYGIGPVQGLIATSGTRGTGATHER